MNIVIEFKRQFIKFNIFSQLEVYSKLGIEEIF